MEFHFDVDLVPLPGASLGQPKKQLKRPFHCTLFPVPWLGEASKSCVQTNFKIVVILLKVPLEKGPDQNLKTGKTENAEEIRGFSKKHQVDLR